MRNTNSCNVKLDEVTHHEFKALCAVTGVTMNAGIHRLVRNEIDKHPVRLPVGRKTKLETA